MANTKQSGTKTIYFQHAHAKASNMRRETHTSPKVDASQSDTSPCTLQINAKIYQQDQKQSGRLRRYKGPNHVNNHIEQNK